MQSGGGRGEYDGGDDDGGGDGNDDDLSVSSDEPSAKF